MPVLRVSVEFLVGEAVELLPVLNLTPEGTDLAHACERFLDFWAGYPRLLPRAQKDEFDNRLLASPARVSTQVVDDCLFNVCIDEAGGLISQVFEPRFS